VKELKMEMRDKILNATIEVFSKKGLKFTMDDIANCANMSKRTIYEVFENKEILFYEMIDYGFDSIKESEREVLENDSLDTLGKIRAILRVLPESYKDIDFGQLYLLKNKYPKIYRRLEERLENGWESTIDLLNQGMKEGVIRNISIPIFKTMFESTIEQFFQRDILIHNKIPYKNALEEVVNILVDGIVD
jgi:AcrR family transcriptional regulator